MLKKSLRTSKFKYWMESEIYQQPMVLADIIRAYRENNDEISIPESVKRVIVVASGSSYHCARFAVDLLERISGVETRAIYSSEFLLKSVIPHEEGTLYIFITQSGETSDTNKALIKAKQSGLKTLCVTNKEDSTIWQASDYRISCHAGVERSIAATKSLTSQMMCMTLLALKFAQAKGIETDYYLIQQHARA